MLVKNNNKVFMRLDTLIKLIGHEDLCNIIFNNDKQLELHEHELGGNLVKIEDSQQREQYISEFVNALLAKSDDHKAGKRCTRLFNRFIKEYSNKLSPDLQKTIDDLKNKILLNKGTKNLPAQTE